MTRLTSDRILENARDRAATFVSVLIPARNESVGIGDCVRAIQRQSHRQLEILVLDDNSVDETANIVNAIDDHRVHLITGVTLPDGWSGKNWACHQLTQHATADIFVFVDADTILEPSAISGALSVLEGKDAGLVSVITASRYKTSTDVVLLPMINFGLMSLFPVWLMHLRFLPKVSVAMGPFIMITRAAYDDAGGHAAAPAEVVDDVMLSRRVKRTKRKVKLCNGTDVATTTWYGTVRGTWQGFSKNAFGAMESNVFILLITFFVVIPCLSLPFFRIAWGVYRWNIPGIVALQFCILVVARVVVAHVGRDPLRSIFAHPITLVFWAATLAWSSFLSLSHRSVRWRDRKVRLGQ